VLSEEREERDEELINQSARDGRDARTRRLILGLAVGLVISLLLLGWAVASYVAEKDSQAQAGADVASTVIAACKDDEAKEQLKQLGISCGDAEKVVDEVKAGPQGIPGIQGPQGEQGPQGNTGPKGDKGEKGDTGDEGSEGLTGAQGSEGLQGPMGVPGPQGEKGETGAQGPQGEVGPQGPTGPQGEEGEDAYPFVFTFLFTTPSAVPGQPERTYRCEIAYNADGVQSPEPAQCVPQ